MHEMSICLALLEQVEQVLRHQGGARARCITVSYGPLAGIDAESLQLCFSLAREGTSAAGAQLVLEQTPCRIRCRHCGLEEHSLRPFDGCRNCASFEIELLSGRELLLRNVEVEPCVVPVAAAKKAAE